MGRVHLAINEFSLTKDVLHVYNCKLPYLDIIVNIWMIVKEIYAHLRYLTQQTTEYIWWESGRIKLDPVCHGLHCLHQCQILQNQYDYMLKQ